MSKQTITMIMVAIGLVAMYFLFLKKDNKESGYGVPHIINDNRDSTRPPNK